MCKIYLRIAEWSDVDLLFEWVNDSEVRRNSFNTTDIKYNEHKQWFENCLQDKNVDIYLCCLDTEPVGQIRLNYEGETAVISYSIVKKHRGHGIGRSLIKLAEAMLIDERTDIKFLNGSVKINNTQSQRIFEENGYGKKYINSDEGYYVYSKMVK